MLTTPRTADRVPNPLEQLTVDDLRRRTSWKWNTYDPDVLPLWVAEMDVALADPIAATLRRAVDDGDIGYPTGTALAEAFSGFAATRWHWDDIVPERTLNVADVMSGQFEVIRTLTEHGDAVIVNPPVYTPFYAYTAHAGRRIVEAPLGTDLRIDFDTLEDAFVSATTGNQNAVYLIANPHNPTGVVHTRYELTQVATLARRYGVRIVSDEIHGPLVLPGTHFTPLLSVPGAENAFAVTSASKAWNLAGLKAGIVVAGTEATELQQLPGWLARGASHLGVLAHTAAFRDGGPWLDALIAGLDSNRALLGRLLAEHLPTVAHTPPEGTYLAWLDCAVLEDALPTTDGAATLFSDMTGATKLFYDRGRVALSSGAVFGPGGAGHTRLNFATSQAVLTDAVTRMGAAAAGLGETP